MGWPDGPAGLTGRAVMNWWAKIFGPVHIFSVGLTGWPIGPNPFCHPYFKFMIFLLIKVNILFLREINNV